MNLYGFQKEVLQDSKLFDRVAYYYDMGLGKTYIGAEKMNRLNTAVNLVVCQKSKIQDWVDHFNGNYGTFSQSTHGFKVRDLTEKNSIEKFFYDINNSYTVGIINYDLLFRRPELSRLKDFTLLLDESSLIQNENSKRARFILNKLRPSNVILLSGTPTGGKYEKLWSQMRLLGWNISKTDYWNRYIDFYVNTNMGFPLKVVRGYKNVEELKRKMREYGCFFKKTDEVFDLPKQNFIKVEVLPSAEYKTFTKKGIVKIEGTELVGNTALNQMLYERQLCGVYSKGKLKALEDLLSSSDDRFIIFYNFESEFTKLRQICEKLSKPIAVIKGEVKDLTQYESKDDSVTLIQYQAGAMGLNLQKANKIVYFTPPLSSELYEQSKKRIHRIGQQNHCFYYNLTVIGSIEERIYSTLALRQDFTERLFKEV